MKLNSFPKREKVSLPIVLQSFSQFSMAIMTTTIYYNDVDDDDYHGDALIQFISQTLQTTVFPRERESWLVVQITAELLSQTES